MNALKHGLRTTALIIPGESIETYREFWDEMEAEWSPPPKPSTPSSRI